MPIIEPVDDSEELSQGDIICDVPLYTTDLEGTAKRVNESLCMVISRPCSACRDAVVNVVLVKQWINGLPESKTFDDALKVLKALRDGEGKVDLFYLGALPSKAERFVAILTNIFTVQVRRKDGKELDETIRKRRIARLHPDYVRDFHTKMFRAFASMGFDDLSWMSTEDLEYALLHARKDIQAVEAAITSLQISSASQAFLAQQTQNPQLDKEKKKLAELNAKAAPYQQELDRRKEHSSPVTAQRAVES